MGTLRSDNDARGPGAGSEKREGGCQRPTTTVSVRDFLVQGFVSSSSARRNWYSNICGQAERPISTGKLRALQLVHPRPINLVVFEGSLGALRPGTPSLEAGFPLRCFQRLSVPYMATRLCPWQDNRNTRGTSTQVLSYYGQLLSSVLRPRQIGTKLSHDVLNPARVPL